MGPNICVLCKGDEETSYHIMFNLHSLIESGIGVPGDSGKYK